MPEYWFIVKPEHHELYETLRQVVARRPGYHVVKERRVAHTAPPGGEERRTATVWEGDEMMIAERLSPGEE